MNQIAVSKLCLDVLDRTRERIPLADTGDPIVAFDA